MRLSHFLAAGLRPKLFFFNKRELSKMKTNHGKLMMAVAVASALTLSACGGGGGDTSSSAPPSGATLSGTVAGGAAVVGTLHVTDSTGQTKSVAIEANGHYSVDVAGMTGPFVLKAAGTVGNTSVTYYSAAVAGDVNGTVNVTPYTDLMVSNIAGQLADAYFASHNPSSALITGPALAAAQSALQAKLAPALQAMGLSTSIDLLRASFAADHTGLDAALDVIKVDNSTSTVSIVNTLTGLSIAHDDVTTGSDDSTAATLSMADSTALGSAITDLQAVQAGFDRFEELFAASLPTTTQLQNSAAFDTANFLDNGRDFSTFATELSTAAEAVGIAFSNVAITLDSPTTGWVTAKISLTNGGADVLEWRVAKINGSWKMQGNQYIAEVGIEPRAQQNISFSGQGPTSTNSGLHMWIDTASYTGTPVASAVVTGLGLPAGGVTMVPLSNGPTWLTVQGGMAGNTIPECLGGATTQCVNIANTVDNGQYNLVLKDAGGNSLNSGGYTLTLTRKPLATSTLTAGMFPTLTSLTVNGSPLTSLTQFVANANLGATLAIPSGYRAEHASVSVYGIGAPNYVYVKNDNLSAATSLALNLGSPVPSGVTSYNAYVLSFDALGRGFATSYY